IPSYREDVRVIRQTLLSAALQEYPHLRVVLLLDDPPNPADPEHRRALERARALPAMVADSLKEPHATFREAVEAFEGKGLFDLVADGPTLDLLADRYEEAMQWFIAEKESLPRVDHTDEFLALEFFDRMAADLRTTAEAVRAAGRDSETPISRRRVHQLYLRLERIFSAEITSFERKQYASLSHEANKAMNLNSYLGLMGGDYRSVDSPAGRVLLSTTAADADLSIPDSDYVLTLDADSILLPEYCLRLVYFLEQPENASVAVAQTPYSAYRGKMPRIERIAGATTDIQHLVHQGLTRHGATFWVGANAVIRKPALEELEEVDDEGGFAIKRYIKDRTVIEDTESSIDLRARGWQLYNYPERLSYSATPSDFGSLIIQRRRWSNGGLVILPTLLRLIHHGAAGTKPSRTESFLRLNYLASVSWANFSLLLLLFYPFDGELLSRFALVTALPYFWTMANDLHRVGYHRRDIFLVYGFNLLLLPVNLAGSLQSLVQAIGGHKIAFARTPKVKNHTVAPLIYLGVPLLLIAWSAHTLIRDVSEQTYYHGAFAAFNLVMTAYGLLVLVGIGGILIDVLVNLKDFVQRPPKPKPQTPEKPHWVSALYVGSALPEELERSAPLAAALAAQDRFDTERDAIPATYAASRRSREHIKSSPANGISD
ncbi:MAG TPA: glycosyltransferase family 2 protein, partial [Dehalococcoidia bacterium]|nr:glycosyltransferase family 2 protein [Dehalococcoidia bacterium]